MSFKNLAGQHELRRLLSSALEKGRLSHAVLLTGPPGSGKRSWGKALAQAILCANRSGAEPCMLCSSCRGFQSGSHPDFFLIEPEKRKIKIDQIRQVRENFYFQGSKKVCLIDRAEMMTAESASSLLKILEDPPEGLSFVLLVEKPRDLLDTIQSRCQRYTLHPLSLTEVTELLTAERCLSADKAALLARISGGLPGQALALADDEQFEKRYEEAKTLAYNLATGCDSAQQLLLWAASLAEREDLVPFLELVSLFYRDGLVQNLCRRGERSLRPDQSLSWIDAVAPALLEDALLLINNTVYELNATNVNRRLLLEKVLILLQRRLSQCRKSSGFASSRPERPTILNPVQI
jgi:DNA polymerase III subunit delta'